MERRRTAYLFLFLGTVLCTGVNTQAAWGDSIVILGKVYNEVLVYKTINNYYVKIPSEGRVIHADREDVDESTVLIINDFMYRRELRKYFDAVTKGDDDEAKRIREAQRAARGKSDGNRLQQLAAEARSRAQSTTPDGPISMTEIVSNRKRRMASGQQGIAVSRAELEATLRSMGFTVSKGAPQNGNPTTVGKGAGGKATITAYGPDSKISRVETSLSGTMADMGPVMSQLGAVLSVLAPWTMQVLQMQGPQLMGGGVIDETRNGVHLYVQVNVQGQNVKANMSIESVV